MRNRALLLSGLFGLSLVVTACGGSSADIKKVGLVTDVGTLEDKSFNEASWVGTQAGAKDLGGTASNIVTKAPTDYAANIKTFVDQGYGIIVTVGFAMGDATTIAAKQYPKVKFIGVDQGVCIDANGKGDPTFACKGDPKKLLPNYQGLVFKEEQVGYLAGVLAGSLSQDRASSAPSAASTPSPRSSATSTATGTAPRRSTTRSTSRSPTSPPTSPRRSTTRAPASRSPQQMIGQKADVIFQVAGLSGARRHRGGLRRAERHRHRRRRRPVASRSRATCQVRPDERREEAGRRRHGRDQARSGTRPTSAAPPSGTPRQRRSASASRRTRATYASLVTPEIQAKIDAALAGMKDGTIDPCKPTACDKKD